jgi:ATP-binding protein involved in chromosome partitioning
LAVPFLGAVPLDMAIRETSDAGRPIVATDPDGVHAASYRAIAEAVWAAVNDRSVVRAAPKIVIES